MINKKVKKGKKCTKRMIIDDNKDLLMLLYHQKISAQLT